MDGIPARPRVEYLSLGKLDTESVLETAGDALTAAGEASLSQVVAEPTIETFMTASRRFAREVGLLTDGIRDVLEAVAENGGEATMAMLGETVVAVGTGLTDAGYDPVVTRTHPGGATLEPPP